jgi:DNA-binding MurR/RpiR family transcriptional regulator
MFKERIRENYDNLTPGFRKLADFIMDSTLDVAFLTATELSRRVGVDPATVVRFAQELGYSGFRELSQEIKRYVRDRVTASYRRVGEANSTEELLRGLIENSRQNLEYFVTTDLATVVETIEVLRDAQHIWCTGEFTGFNIAEYFARRLQIQGVPATAFEPGMASLATALTAMNADDVLMVFAGTEPSLDAGYAVRMANEKGLRTITLTGSGVALPARESNVTVIVPHKSPAGVPAFGAIMQVLSLIWEALMTPGSEEMQQRARENQEKMNQLLKLRAETPEYEITPPGEMWKENLS